MKRMRTLLTLLAVACLVLGTALAQPLTELPVDERFDVPVAFSTGLGGESLPAMISALARSVGLTPLVDGVPDITIVYDIGDSKPFRQVWSLILTLNDLDYVLQANDVVVVGTPERLRRLAGLETREPTTQRFYRVSNDPSQVATILERVVPDASIDTLPGNNAVIVVGTAAEHEAVATALAEFDQPRDQIALAQHTFFLSHAEAVALAETIADTVIVLDASGNQVADYRVVPDARTNSLVVTGGAAVLERIGRLIADLDTPDRVEPEPEPEVEVEIVEPTVRRLYRSNGDVERIAAIIERVVPDARIDVLPRTNAFYVAGTEAEHDQVEAAIAEFDPMPPEEPEPPAESEAANEPEVVAEPTSEQIYRVRNDPEQMAAIVSRVVPGTSVDVLPGTNALIVVATAAGHDAAAAALAEFDVVETTVPLEQRTYFLSNARAADLADVLQRALRGDDENGARLEETTVVAESRTNSLIVTGSAAAQQRFGTLITELDGPQRQVNIQVRIQEITRSASLSLGIDWGAGFGNLSSQILSGGLSFIFDTTQVISSLNVLAVLDALESQGLTRRVDDSNITVLDAGTGSIQSGGTLFITLPGANTNIERTIPYGVQIDVTPRIAADGRITLEVVAKVDDLVSTATDPTFQNIATRNVSTTISVEEGQTVLLGGLLQNSLTLSRRQIPVLGSLPLIGDLFSQNITDENSVDLLLILTAQIID